MRRAIVASALFLALTGAVKAVNMSDLYDQGTLAAWGAKYRISTQKILDKVIMPALLAEEQRAIGDVHIDFPPYPLPSLDSPKLLLPCIAT